MPTRERNTKRKVREIEEVLRASLLVNSMSDADENDVGSDDVDEFIHYSLACMADLRSTVDFAPRTYTQGRESLYKDAAEGGLLTDSEMYERLRMTRAQQREVYSILFEDEEEYVKLPNKVTIDLFTAFLMAVRRCRVTLPWGDLAREFDYDRTTCCLAHVHALRVLEKRERWVLNERKRCRRLSQVR